MLTESEKRWLLGRELSPNPYCGWCMKYALCCSPLYNKCPTKTADLGDALAFSERVAVKLAINDTSYLPCHQKGHENQCPYDNFCPTDKKKTAWCKIKHARLAVEEEMDEAD